MASTSTTNPPSHKDAKRRGSLHNQLVWTAPASASTNSCVVLPLGNHVVTAAKRSTGALQQDLRIPAEANELTPFSCWQCLAHPDEASDTLVTQGYGRLQILLAYLLPEVIDVYEDNLEASQLSTPLAKQALDDADANKPGREDTAATLSDYKPNFTITSLAPSKGYVRISLNGVPVYRSSILDISPDALNETAAVVKGEKDETKLPNTIFNERIEIQIHWPYSVLRVELFNRDTTLGVVADDDLLGVFEMPIHLMLPFKIYDLEVEFPPQFLREENEDWISGQGLDSPFILGEKRCVSPEATAQLLQSKQIFDPDTMKTTEEDQGDTPSTPTSSSSSLGDTSADLDASKTTTTVDHPLKKEARLAAKDTQEKLYQSEKEGSFDLLSCTMNMAAAASASAPQISGVRTSSFSYPSKSTVVEEDWEEKPRPPLLPEGYSCGPRLRCLFQMEVVGATAAGKVGAEKSGGSYFSEMCALALPMAETPDDEASLPPLNFRKLYHDFRRCKTLIWDRVLKGFVDTLISIPTWEHPFLSFCCLAGTLLVTYQPSSIFALLFFLLGLLGLMFSLAPISNTTEAAIAAASVLADAKKKPPPSVLEKSDQKYGRTRKATEDHEKEHDAHTTDTKTKKKDGRRVSSLSAFEKQQELDESTMEDSLLKSLLSSAVPKSIHTQVRQAHKILLSLTGSIICYHEKLRQRREVAVGSLWLLSLLSLYRPDLAAFASRVFLGGAGVLFLIHQMPIVSPTLRFLVASLSYLRLLHLRRTRQSLVAAAPPSSSTSP